MIEMAWGDGVIDGIAVGSQIWSGVIYAVFVYYLFKNRAVYGWRMIILIIFLTGFISAVVEIILNMVHMPLIPGIAILIAVRILFLYYALRNKL